MNAVRPPRHGAVPDQDAPVPGGAGMSMIRSLPDGLDTALVGRAGGQTVVRGDCLDVLPSFPDATFDCVVTSPPYNIGVAYASHDDRMPEAEYLDWLDRVWTQVRRVLRDDGSFFLNVGGAAKDPAKPLRIGLRAAAHFTLQNHIVWAKSVSIGHRTHGHFKPINSARFLNNTHEQLFHFTKHGGVALDRLAVGVEFSDKSNIARFGHAEDRRCAGNVWFISYDTVRSKAQRFHHPAAFPPALAERCIRLTGRERPRVLDPFLGTGSTLVAAMACNAEGVGIEITDDYCGAALARLRQQERRDDDGASDPAVIAG